MTRSQLTAITVGLGIVAIVAVNAAINYGSCHWYGYQTERTVRFAMGVGCMVKMESGWTPKMELRTEQ